MWRKMLIVLLAVGVAAALSTTDKMAMDTPSYGKVIKSGSATVLNGYSLIESQDFNDGAIPAGWETYDPDGDGCTWVVVASPTDPFEPGCWDGSPFLQYSDDDCDFDSDDWVMTAVFETDEGGHTYLIYDFDFEEFGISSPFEYGDVMIGESDNGVDWTWTVVSTYDYDTGEMCDITEGPVTVNSNFARWAFRYWEEVPSDWAWGWYIDNVEIWYEPPTGVAERSAQNISSFSVNPNPSLGVATVSFTLARTTNVKLTLLDATGRVVDNLLSGTYSSGAHTVKVSAAPGVYFVKLDAQRNVELQKLVILK